MREYEQYEKYVINEQIDLTVAIITYNRCDMLKNTVNSVLNQEYKEFALIVIDNASTDNTFNVVSEINDSRVFYYCHEKNIGGIENINSAFDLAKTKYLVVFHDDDIMLPTLLGKELAFIKDNKCTMVSSRANFVDENGESIMGAGKLDINEFTGSLYLEHVLSGKESVIFPTLMYDLSFFERNSLRVDSKAGPCCDLFFISEICMTGGSLYIIDEKLIERVIHSSQDSVKSEFWMNIMVLNYFCSFERYLPVILKNQKNVIKGYKKNILHLLANLYEKKVSIVKYKEVVCNINLRIFKKSFQLLRFRFLLFNATKNTRFSSFTCHILRKIIRKIKHR